MKKLKCYIIEQDCSSTNNIVHLRLTRKHSSMVWAAQLCPLCMLQSPQDVNPWVSWSEQVWTGLQEWPPDVAIKKGSLIYHVQGVQGHGKGKGLHSQFKYIINNVEMGTPLPHGVISGSECDTMCGLRIRLKLYCNPQSWQCCYFVLVMFQNNYNREISHLKVPCYLSLCIESYSALNKFHFVFIKCCQLEWWPQKSSSSEDLLKQVSHQCLFKVSHILTFSCALNVGGVIYFWITWWQINESFVGFSVNGLNGHTYVRSIRVFFLLEKSCRASQIAVSLKRKNCDTCKTTNSNCEYWPKYLFTFCVKRILNWIDSDAQVRNQCVWLISLVIIIEFSLAEFTRNPRISDNNWSSGSNA